MTLPRATHLGAVVRGASLRALRSNLRADRGVGGITRLGK